jgi:hypothetical protein
MNIDPRLHFLLRRLKEGRQFNNEVQHLGEPTKNWYPKWIWERDINN